VRRWYFQSIVLKSGNRFSAKNDATTRDPSIVLKKPVLAKAGMGPGFQLTTMRQQKTGACGPMPNSGCLR
jgi:hypothetical protein